MFNFGVPELVLILIIGLVIFGPGKLPGVGKALGQSIKEFRSAEKGDKKELMADNKNDIEVTSKSEDDK